MELNIYLDTGYKSAKSSATLVNALSVQYTSRTGDSEKVSPLPDKVSAFNLTAHHVVTEHCM